MKRETVGIMLLILEIGIAVFFLTGAHLMKIRERREKLEREKSEAAQ
jgi:hypothetical protein